jgi:hypothetical protein
MKGSSRRTFLGRDHRLAERVRVYRTAEALEIAYVSAFDVSTKRVFFDEVQLLTLHRTRAGRARWLLGISAALFGLGALLARTVPSLFAVLLALAAATATGSVAAALAPIWVVSIYGRRARARVRCAFREARARALYAELERQAREAQGAAADAGQAVTIGSDQAST